MTLKIREVREQRGWTQEDLADASDVSLSTIHRAEEGANVRLDTLALIAQALGVDVSDLLPKADSPVIYDN